ncbi:MAG: hypothetical protein LC127_06270 [Chitinophagales bacterium]|nr:hypothetical protein [Chitinophagales bacterium]
MAEATKKIGRNTLKKTLFPAMTKAVIKKGLFTTSLIIKNIGKRKNMTEFDKEKWHTEGWTRDELNDEPEIVYKDGKTFPQFVGFRDKEGRPFLISRVAAIALGLIGMHDVPDWSVDIDEYIKIKNKKFFKK